MHPFELETRIVRENVQCLAESSVLETQPVTGSNSFPASDKSYLYYSP